MAGAPPGIQSPILHQPRCNMTLAEHPLPQLTAVEARVLGVLVEKQLTVPDTYPLTMNSLLAGCNQKTSREPVMHLTEAEVQEALDSLRRQTLVVESFGASGRVLRYAQNLDRVLRTPGPTTTLLAVLMLRGPQTPGELRSNSDRLYRFADTSALEAYLDEMATRSAGALVMQLPKQPGSREHRYAHLLCGTPDMAALSASSAGAVPDPAAESLMREVDNLRLELGKLNRLVHRLYAEMGMDPEA